MESGSLYNIPFFVHKFLPALDQKLPNLERTIADSSPVLSGTRAPSKWRKYFGTYQVLDSAILLKMTYWPLNTILIVRKMAQYF